MGAINFYTSAYITLALEPFDMERYKNDGEFMTALKNYTEAVDEEAMAEACDEYAEHYYWAIYQVVKEALDRRNFYWYHVALKCGYYESFQVVIDSNFPVAFNCYQDRADANKEVTEIKKFLNECVEIGLVQTHPGWCTSYEDAETTKAAIKDAVRQMRAEIGATPTWNQYECGVNV